MDDSGCLFGTPTCDSSETAWLGVIGVFRRKTSSQVLVNFYLDGRAQIKWHADDEHLKTSEFSCVFAFVFFSGFPMRMCIQKRSDMDVGFFIRMYGAIRKNRREASETTIGLVGCLKAGL